MPLVGAALNFARAAGSGLVRAGGRALSSRAGQNALSLAKRGSIRGSSKLGGFLDKKTTSSDDGGGSSSEKAVQEIARPATFLLQLARFFGVPIPSFSTLIALGAVLVVCVLLLGQIGSLPKTAINPSSVQLE